MSKKGAHPGKHQALAEYKRLYIEALESPMGDPVRKECQALRGELLKDPLLGITVKHLDRAEDEALVARHGKMVGANS